MSTIILCENEPGSPSVYQTSLPASAGIVNYAIPSRTCRLPLERRINRLECVHEPCARKNWFSRAISTLRSDLAHPVSLRFKAHCALLLCSFLWGVTFVVVKDALADISVFGYLAARFVLGALPLIWIYREDLRKLTRDEVWAGIQVGLFMFGGYAFQTAGIARTTPSKAAFITGLERRARPRFSCRVLAKENWRVGLGRGSGLFRGTLFPHGAEAGICRSQSRRFAGDGLRGALRVSNHLHCALHRKIFAGSVELPAGDPRGSGFHDRRAHLKRDGRGTFLCPLHIPDGVRRDRHGDFHDRARLSASRVGTTAYHGDEHGADSHDRTCLRRDHFLPGAA